MAYKWLRNKKLYKGSDVFTQTSALSLSAFLPVVIYTTKYTVRNRSIKKVDNISWQLIQLTRVKCYFADTETHFEFKNKLSITLLLFTEFLKKFLLNFKLQMQGKLYSLLSRHKEFLKWKLNWKSRVELGEKIPKWIWLFV
jgi:hypothetical protein